MRPPRETIDGPLSRRVAVALHALFLVSGALALAYEVLWMRRFAVLFGATGPSVAATLSALFLGLGLGSALAAARADRWRRPVVAFGLLEAGIGAGALLAEAILRAAESLTLPAGAAGMLARFGLALAAVLLPATLMGASLPVLGRAVAPARDRAGLGAGALYAINTLGAALGALAVPLLLLPRLGATGSLLVLAAGSVLVGAAALALGRGVAPNGASPVSAPAATAVPRRLLALAFLSGLVTLALETTWSRALALVHESSVLAFAVVLAVFLAGLGAGALLARRLLAGARDPERVLAAAWLIAGLAVIASPAALTGLTHGLRALTEGSAARLGAIAVAVMLPATIAAGVALPVLFDLGARRSGAGTGRVLGSLLAANTIGALLGPPLAAFLVIPALGPWAALVVLGAVLLATGTTSGRPLAPPMRLAAVGAAIVVALAAHPWSLPRVALSSGERLLSLREGALGSVAVVQRGESLRIKVDNSYTIGGTASTGDERLQAHLPLLLHPRPRRVAFLGLGTGITAGAALLHPVERVEAVELLPEIVSAAGAELADANLGITVDPRVAITVDDARSWLRSRPGAFDVVVGDLFVPWRRGEASLYALEHVKAMRDALAPGGIACQWIPLFQLSPDEVAVLARTFTEVFPHATAWRGDFTPDEPALALIATRDGTPLQPSLADARVAALSVTGDPANPQLRHPASLWMHLLGPVERGDAWLRDAAINDDAHPGIELRSRRAHASRGTFTGEALSPWLAGLRARDPRGTLLSELDATHAAWRDAGGDLWRAALLASQGRSEEADAAGEKAFRSLPEGVRAALIGAL